MRKLILKCEFAVGDLVMMTAAVRDLHRHYPGQFLTDVRTACPGLWESNPYVHALPDSDPEVEAIHCSYPLIDHCDATPYHCLHGFVHFLNERLKLKIRPTEFRGDIHLSPREWGWFSQVHELTREPTPFWIVAAGGKYDITIKWWETARYQRVIDHYRGRVLFVQVGEANHHHPKLDGALDLRGKTTLRELIRLVYHSEGVLCPVTSLMHLAAAVPVPPGRAARRACVVVAGGREPAHWEAYPGHQFLHMNAGLRCCGFAGCWRDRTAPLRDGDKRDGASLLCRDVVEGLPRCMHLITPEMVIERIETYYRGGALNYLSRLQWRAAERGVRASEDGWFDRRSLNLHSAGMACDAFVRTLPALSSGHWSGRGIVICGGGERYLPCAWVCIRLLRLLGCTLPIQVWHLRPEEMPVAVARRLRAFHVECVDARRVRRKHPCRRLAGWELKAYALLYSPFEEVLLLDADNVPVANPEYLFLDSEYRRKGAVFWPDLPHPPRPEATKVWRSCGLRRPPEAEFESGQILVDKSRCWRALRLALWFNEHSDFYYRHIHGDKETFHLAFRKLGAPYHLVRTPVEQLPGTMCQHDLQGRVLFQHRNTAKWTMSGPNPRIDGFRHEEECRRFLQEFRRLWPGMQCHVSPNTLQKS